MASRAPLPWFRLHAEARTDAKLESLPDDEFRVWFRLLCLASQQPERGVIAGFSVRLLAVEVAHGDAALLGRTLASLIELRIIESDKEANTATFTHWLERQYDKESDWPENTRARKAEQRSRDVTLSHAESRDVTLSHAESRDVTRRHAIEEYRDRETERESDPTVVMVGEDTPRERTVAPVASHGALALVPPSPSAKASAIITPLKPIPKPTPKSARAPDLLWDACVLACDGNGPANDAERGKWNKGLKSLRQSGATPEEIALRAERYRRRYGDGIPLNPMALAGNWTPLATEVNHNGHSDNHRAGNVTGSNARGDRRSARRNANAPKPLPDAGYWERYAAQLEREGRLAKPRSALPQV